ncbi:2-oxoglutarate dehydrogenase complex dihydrolipoyllysine-residue succinyltransferase [bacterium]|nr:2-oxoglutarate dehydrogenase complex dihydrolipoyllysine-residue succinyltransferase [bacterium]
MIAEIKVPEVGESITEGVITEWLKKDGDFVKQDEEIFELETDKITMNVATEHTGVLSIKVEADSEVQVGQVVATIDTEASAPVSSDDNADSKETESKETDPPLSAPAGMEQVKEKLNSSETASEEHDTGDLSPAVRRMVDEYKLDPAKITGTGKGGRLTKEDVIKHMEQPSVAPKPEKTPPPAPPVTEKKAEAPKVTAPPKTPRDPAERQTRKKMSQLRQRVAERLVMAQQEAAMLTTFNEVDMSRVMELRNQYKEMYDKRYGIKLGFMSFFVKAAVEALKTVPEVNAMIDGDDIVQNHFYDIGIAVSTDKGLVVPVIRDADKLSFAEVEQAIADLAKRARERKLTLDDLQGGVYTISNGGIFGSMLSTPILNPPQSAILGLHAIKKRPVVMPDESIVARPIMYLAMSYDHRIVDGRESVTFLKRIVECIENPERMMLGI